MNDLLSLLHALPPRKYTIDGHRPSPPQVQRWYESRNEPRFIISSVCSAPSTPKSNKRPAETSGVDTVSLTGTHTKIATPPSLQPPTRKTLKHAGPRSDSGAATLSRKSYYLNKLRSEPITIVDEHGRDITTKDAGSWSHDNFQKTCAPRAQLTDERTEDLTSHRQLPSKTRPHLVLHQPEVNKQPTDQGDPVEQANDPPIERSEEHVSDAAASNSAVASPLDVLARPKRPGLTTTSHTLPLTGTQFQCPCGATAETANEFSQHVLGSHPAVVARGSEGEVVSSIEGGPLVDAGSGENHQQHSSRPTIPRSGIGRSNGASNPLRSSNSLLSSPAPGIAAASANDGSSSAGSRKFACPWWKARGCPEGDPCSEVKAASMSYLVSHLKKCEHPYHDATPSGTSRRAQICVSCRRDWKVDDAAEMAAYSQGHSSGSPCVGPYSKERQVPKWRWLYSRMIGVWPPDYMTPWHPNPDPVVLPNAEVNRNTALHPPTLLTPDRISPSTSQSTDPLGRSTPAEDAFFTMSAGEGAHRSVYPSSASTMPDPDTFDTSDMSDYPEADVGQDLLSSGATPSRKRKARNHQARPYPVHHAGATSHPAFSRPTDDGTVGPNLAGSSGVSIGDSLQDAQAKVVNTEMSARRALTDLNEALTQQSNVQQTQIASLRADKEAQEIRSQQLEVTLRRLWYLTNWALPINVKGNWEPVAHEVGHLLEDLKPSVDEILERGVDPAMLMQR